MTVDTVFIVSAILIVIAIFFYIAFMMVNERKQNVFFVKNKDKKPSANNSYLHIIGYMQDGVRIDLLATKHEFESMLERAYKNKEDLQNG